MMMDERVSTVAWKSDHAGSEWPWPTRSSVLADAGEALVGGLCLPYRPRAQSDVQHGDLSSAWAWSVKNTFVQVSDDEDSCPPDSARRNSDPGASSWELPSTAGDDSLEDDWAEGLASLHGTACAAKGIAPAEEAGPWGLKGEASENGDRGLLRSRPNFHFSAWTWHVRNTFVEVGSGDSDGSAPPSPGRRSDPGTRRDAQLLDAAWACKERPAEWSDDDEDAMREEAFGPDALCAGVPVPPPPKPFVAIGEEEEVLSVGSIGHPVLCTLMCKNLQLGHCPSGAACGFCHHSDCHTRRKQLDKKNRDTFRRMTARRKLDVMLPILRAKVQAMDSGSGLTEALEEWWSKVDGEFPPPQDDTSAQHSRERRLETFLKCMSVTDLCNLPGPQDGHLKGIAQQLLQELRCAVSASRDATACANP